MKIIALCGVGAEPLRVLERIDGLRLLRFDDQPDCLGSVALARRLRDDLRVDWAVVGYCSAIGLAACDQLAAQPGAPPIVWLCDREEFLPEAARLGVRLGRSDGASLPEIIGGEHSWNIPLP